MPTVYYNVARESMKKPTPFSIRLAPELRAALDKIAEKEGRTTGNLISRILTEWIAAKKRR